MCPLKSYRKYLSKRNTACDALFQTPRDAFNDSDGVWYEKRPLGKNKLGSMMCEISQIAKLSKKYTNHCIRATAITALDQAGFASRHIMSVSGHRSEASIKSYSRKTPTDQKRKMSETLGKLIPLNSGRTTTDKNEAENFEKNTDNFDNEMDQSCDELLYMSAAETELILQDITNITETENRNQSKSSTIVQEKVYNEIHCTRNENPSFIFKDCNVNFYCNQ